MTFAGSLAFFGLAVVTMDVLGGVIAIGVMLRGGTVRHLLAFAGGYTVRMGNQPTRRPACSSTSCTSCASITRSTTPSSSL